jgi:hypothetical protein
LTSEYRSEALREKQAHIIHIGTDLLIGDQKKMDNNLLNLNADELLAYASAKHLAGVPDDEIQRSIVQMLKNDGWKEAAIAPMINEIARRTKGVAETKGSPRSPPKAA